MTTLEAIKLEPFFKDWKVFEKGIEDRLSAVDVKCLFNHKILDSHGGALAVSVAGPDKVKDAVIAAQDAISRMAAPTKESPEVL